MLQSDTINENNTLRNIAFIIAAGLFLSPLLYFDALFNPSQLPRYAMISIISSLSSALLIISLWRKQTKPIWHPLNLVLIVFSFITLISGLWSLDSGGYYLNIVPFIALILLYFVTTYLHAYTTLFFSVTLLAAFYAAIIGLLQNYQLDPFDYRDASVMASTFVYKNHAALYFDLIIPTSLALILITKNVWLRWCVTFATAICLSFVLETHTRGSWLALGLTLIAASIFLMIKRHQLTGVIQSIKKARFELLAIIVICCAFIYSPSQIDETWSRDSDYGEEVLDTSSSVRLSIYKNSMTMLMDNPMGVGFGSFWKGFREYTNYPEIIQVSDVNIIVYRAHSEPLQYFLELGLFGGLLALLIFFYLMAAGIKTILKINNPNHKILCFGITAALLASALHGVVDFPLHKPSSALQFWVLAGLLIGFTGTTLNAGKTVSYRQTKAVLVGFTLVIIASIVFSTHLYYSHINANLHHQNAILANKDCDRATSEIETALRYSPYYFRTHTARIDIYFRCEKDNKKILPVLNEELGLDKNNTKALIKRGYIYLENGEFELAYNDFNRIKTLLPHKVYGPYGIAQTLLSSGYTVQGLAELKAIIKQFPKFKDAKQQLRDVEAFLINQQ